MGRIEQIKKQDLADKRSRWLRDGLVGALVGSLAGIVGSFQYSTESIWLVPTACLAGGVLGAIFGDRVLPYFNW